MIRGELGRSRSRFAARSAAIAALVALLPGTASGQSGSVSASSPDSPGGSFSDPEVLTPAEAASYLSYTSPDTAFVWLGNLADKAEDRLEVEPLVTVPGSSGGRPAVVPVARVSAGPNRDLAIGDLRPLLERLEVAIVPAANPIGMRAGTRVDASGEDPNRDHLVLASPVNRALWRLHSEIEPHVVLDLHEMGPSPFEAQVGLPTHPNVDPRLTELARYWLLPYVVRALAQQNIRFHEYIAENPDPSYTNELAAPADSFFSWAPISADNARNAFSLAGSVGLLLETASKHEIDDLARRSDRLFLTTVSFLEVIAGLSDEVLARAWNSPDHREASSPFLSLRAEQVDDPEQPYLRWLHWNEKGNLVPLKVERWRPAVRVTASMPLPGAWVVTPEGADLVAHLRRHGIRVEILHEPVTLEVSAYRTPDIVEPAVRTFPAGSWVIRADQARQRLLFSLIEPGSDDGWLYSPPPGLARTAADLLAAFAPEDEAISARSEGDPSPPIDLPLFRIEGSVPDLPLSVADAAWPDGIGGRP
ncbi:MAG: hypothetical protein P8049_12425 [Gemmatimonadota bacterium]